MEDPLKSVGVICVSGKVPICFCIGIGWSSKWINGVISRGGSEWTPLGRGVLVGSGAGLEPVASECWGLGVSRAERERVLVL